MKKLIALLLAVSAMAMSTSAFAFTVSPVGEGAGASRNYVTNKGHVDGSDAFVDGTSGITASTAYLPTYRKGDTITFVINGIGEGDNVLTFICSYLSDLSDGDYNNGNVQMIDQVTLVPENDSASCTYKLRNTLKDGLYKLEMRLNGGKQDFSFLIGTPSVELLYVNEIADGDTPTKADKYLLRNGYAFCFGKATITGGANFSQVGTDFGFVFNGTYDDKFIKKTEINGDKLTPYANEALQASITYNGDRVVQELGGEANYFFRMVFEEAYTFNGTEPTGDELTAIYEKLPDVNVFLND